MWISNKKGTLMDVSNGTLKIEPDGSVEFIPHSGKKSVVLEAQLERTPEQLQETFERAIVHGYGLVEL